MSRTESETATAGTADREARTYVARQPIFDRELRVHGYEILFRGGIENRFTGDRERASAAVIANSCLLFELETLAAGRLAFVNVTRDVLLADYLYLLPRKKVVVEILEDVEPDDEVVEACHALRAAGYRIALDDFVYHPRFDRLLAIADYVKVDLQLEDPVRTAVAIRRSGSQARLLAEKVETHEAFRHTESAGYELFQGFFFSRPAMFSQRDVPGQQQHLLHLLRQLHRPDLDLDDLEDLIKQDVALCYKLLRYMNAAHHGLRYPVGSVRRALILLGERAIRRWVTLVVVASLGEGQPPELVRQALIRARFCESLSKPWGLDERGDDLFLTGMFSILGTLLGRPMHEIIATLPVCAEIRDALTNGGGTLAPVYRFGVEYERAAWSRLASGGPTLRESEISRLYLDAVEWGTRCFQSAEPKRTAVRV